jgi:hypothetical protein
MWNYYNVAKLPDLICCLLGFHNFFINALKGDRIVYCCEHCGRYKTVWLRPELPARWL